MTTTRTRLSKAPPGSPIRALVVAAICLTDAERAMLLALEDAELDDLARWLNADLSSWQAAAEWNRTGRRTPLSTSRAYSCGRALWRVLGLPRRCGRGLNRPRETREDELAADRAAARLPAISGRIIALLECEPEHLRRMALENWARMQVVPPER